MVGHLWARLVNMNSERLNYKVFKWSYNLAVRNFHNWTYRTVQYLKTLNIEVSMKEHVHAKTFCPLIKEKVQSVEISKWKNDLERNEAINGTGGNKLRTYKTFAILKKRLQKNVCYCILKM